MISSAIKVIAVILAVWTIAAADQPADPSAAAQKYLSLWQSGDYSAMYDMLSKQSKNYVSRIEFVAWHQEFRDKYIIERFEITAVENKGQRARVEYRLHLTTIAGSGKTKYATLLMVKEQNQWKLCYE